MDKRIFSLQHAYTLMTTQVVSAYQFCQISRYLQNVLLSIILVRIGFSIADIGAFEIVLFVIALLSQFWISGFKEGLVSKISQVVDNEHESWLAKTTLSYVFVGLVAALLFAGLAPIYLKAESGRSWPNLIIFGSLFLCFQAWGNLGELMLLVRKKAKELFWFGLLSGIGFVIALLWLWGSEPSWFLVFILLLGFNGLKSIFSFWTSPPLPSGVWWREIYVFFKWSVPFFLISMIGYGMEMMDGFLVVHFFDDAIFPIYKYGAREFPISSLLLNSLSVAMIPVLQKAGSLESLKQKVNRYMHILFPLSIALIFCSKYAFTWVYGESFLPSATIFNMYLLILGSRLLLPHSVLMARGEQRLVLYSGIFEFAINVALSLWWVNIWGISGLVAATVVAYYAQKIYLFIRIYEKWRLSLRDFIAVRWWIFYQVAAVLALYASNRYG